MDSKPTHAPLPLPEFYHASKVDEVWRVPYEERAGQALAWAEQHAVQPSDRDSFKIHLVAIDVQNTFCLPDFELFVAGRSGTGAVQDNIRFTKFIYANIDRITRISASLDTHQAIQIFHAIFLVDQDGRHPGPYATITAEEIRNGRWRFNPVIADSLGVAPDYGQRHLARYTQQLEATGKYALTIWPYHAMLGGIGHALVSGVEEAFFFHSVLRNSQVDFILKGENPFTEHYSAMGPEVTEGPEGGILARRSDRLFKHLQAADAMIIAGQAKSHCVSWTISDLLGDIAASDQALAQKVYLLEDCTSPVVVPGADFSDLADEAFARFAAAGMHRVKSTELMTTWPGPISSAL